MVLHVLKWFFKSLYGSLKNHHLLMNYFILQMVLQIPHMVLWDLKGSYMGKGVIMTIKHLIMSKHI